jgi:BirA family biotin operon repressor/biotin-[acetyl-CoA-carboxylase] ligase
VSESALRLLDVLADGDLHSGEALAQRFGVSRAALGKWVGQLREWGVEVLAQPGTGYRLSTSLERLEASRIQTLMSKTAPRLNVLVLTETDSTNTQLLAADAAADPQALLAERQTAGRGRRGRTWLSPFGSNLYLSLAWSFPSWPARITTLPLAVAVAVARVIDAASVPEVGIKWPNDLHVDGRKLAGILIEPRGEAGGACRVVIGIGINVSMQEAAGLEQPWTSLREVLARRGQITPSRNALAAALLSELATSLPHFATHGFSPFAAEWKRRDLLAGRPVRIEGNPTLEGIAKGLDADGGLVVETADGRQSVHAGEVSVRRA